MPKNIKDILTMDVLYHKQSSSETQYNAMGLGVIDIPQVLKGNPKMFKMVSSGMLAKKQRTLVFWDPMHKGWSAQKQEDVENCLQCLLDAGFAILALNEKGISLEPIVSANSFFKRDNNICPYFSTSQETLIKDNLTLVNKPRSEICFFNTFTINEMLSRAFDHYAHSELLEVTISEAQSLVDDLNVTAAQLHETLNQSHHGGVHWILNELTNANNHLFNQMLVFAPQQCHIAIDRLEGGSFINSNINASEDYESIDCPYSKNGIKLLIQGGDNPASLDIMAKNVAMKTTVRELEFFVVDFSTFDLDLSAIRSVDKLVFSNCDNIEAFIRKIDHVTNTVRHLVFNKSNISFETFSSLINKCTMLTSLSMNENKDRSFLECGSFSFNLPHLESIKITNTDYIKVRFFKAILKLRMTSTVKLIDLSGSRLHQNSGEIGFIDNVIFHLEDNHEPSVISQNINKYVHNFKFNISHIKSISLANTQVNENDVKALLNTCIHVESLDISDQNLGDIEIGEDIQYKNLRILRMTGNEEDVENIVKRTLSLESLWIIFNSPSEFSESIVNRIADLKEISLSGHITLYPIYQAIHASRKLTSISVKRDIEYEENTDIDNCLSLIESDPENNVDSLTVSLCNMNAPECALLFNTLTNIQYLNMLYTANCQYNIDTNSLLNQLNVNALQKVERFTVNVEDYAECELSIINRMINLKELEISTDTNGALNHEYFSQYSSLKKITISHMGERCNAIFVGLINQSVNLKYLKICVNDRDDADGDLQDWYVFRIKNTKLEVIDISGGTFLDRRSLFKLLSRNKNIREIRIRDRRDLANFIIPEGLTQLKIIDIEGVPYDQSHLSQLQAIAGNAIVGNIAIFINDTFENIKILSSDSQTEDVDVDTRNINESFNLTQYFIGKNSAPPSPSHYRESVSNHVHLKEGIFKRGESPFSLVNIGDPRFRDCPGVIFNNDNIDELFNDFEDDANHYHFMGRKSLILSKTPQRLPSLHANEIITHFSISGLSPDEFYLQYSERDNFYYISSTRSEGSNVTVEFLLESPCHVDTIADEIYSDPDIPNELPDEYTEGDAQYWKNALITTKAGACRHKALAYFMDNKDSNKKVRIVTNKSHAYVEVHDSDNDRWTKIDLGGHPANEIINNDLFRAKPPSRVVIDMGINPAFEEETDLSDVKRPPKEYILDLMNHHPGKNIYLDFPNDESLESFQQLSRELAHHEGRPIFYIDSPNDIACHQPRMLRNDRNEGVLVNNPGGPLYEFLHTQHPLAPVIIVNFNRFSAEELVRFNSIIDKERVIDRERIPKQATVIGLYQSARPDSYQGTDFTSRFDLKLHPSFTEAELNACIDESMQPDILNHTHSVYLHHSDEWRNLLCGRWHLSSKGWLYEEGPLVKALGSNTSITLHDAPWEDRDFQCFMTQMRIEKTVTIEGKTYQIPKGFVAGEGPPFPLDQYTKNCIKVTVLEKDDTISHDAYILNTVTFSQLFNEYYVENIMLCSRSGVLSQSKTGESIDLFLSHDLSLSQWGQLIQTAHDKGLHLNICIAQGLNLPETIKSCLQDSDTETSHEPIQSSLIEYHTQNVNNSIEAMRNNLKSPLIFDCTGLQPSDLFGCIVKSSTDDFLSFKQTDSIIDTLLNKNIDVILTGTLSPELEQYLFQWASKRIPSQAKLHYFTEQDRTIFKHIAHCHYDDGQKPVKERNLNLVEHCDAHDFIAERTDKLAKALDTCPIVLITGPTGVGKSTFMLEHFAKNPSIELHNGLDNIDHWLASLSSGKDIALFIDEANIAEDKKQEWTEFAGLLLNKHSPTIIWKGKTYTLTPQHKVVFAGNPHTYGGERYQPRLFKDYPMTQLEFKPIKTSAIAVTVLAPVLGHLPEYKDIYPIFVKAYDEVIASSGSYSLITPRELKHMAHMYLAYANRYRGDPAKLAERCAVTMAKQLLPSTLHKKLSFDAEPLNLPTEEPMQGYFVTESRKPIESRLNEFLAIRELKIDNRKITGGLGGIILEGDPGTGKSEHVVAQLVAQGFSEGDHYWREDKRFYRIPVNLGYSEKKALLYKAYIEGAVVIVDEINTSPAMERFYNDALSGTLEIPASMQPVDVKPGFLLIGTQNPTSMEGRRLMSVAMQRRLMRSEVPPYQHDEMVEILVKAHGVKPLLAEQIVTDFDRANKQHKTPLPFRVLLKRYQEAVPFIVKTYAPRCESMVPEQRMAFIQSLLVQPITSSGATGKTAILDRRAHAPRPEPDPPAPPAKFF